LKSLKGVVNQLTSTYFHNPARFIAFEPSLSSQPCQHLAALEYQGDDSLYSMKLMWRIEDQAREASGLDVNKNDVIAAWDQMSTVVPIPLHTTRAKKVEGANSVQA
jgi:hypothetical protein